MATQSGTQSHTIPNGTYTFDVQKKGFFVISGQPELKLVTEQDLKSTSKDTFTSIDDEFDESEFKGPEETDANSVDDEPIGNIYTDLTDGQVANVTFNTIQLSPGSKLITKSGNFYFIGSPGNGLAGQRLKLIIQDLEKHLNSNGFSGTKLANNGVTRDLVASTYPNNPARAVASLHGAGLAIDLKFNIPGKKWTGIGDNGNLASDHLLTKEIARWVASQGDLTWGAEWGDSDPKNGIVKGRGVTEYHHFEIRANKIPEYWKPFEEDLKKLGFSINKLNRTGRGSELERLNQTLLSSQGVS